MGKWEYETRKCKNCLHNRRHLPLIRILAPFLLLLLIDEIMHTFLTLFTPLFIHTTYYGAFFLENDLMGDTLALMAGNYFIFPHFTHL